MKQCDFEEYINNNSNYSTRVFLADVTDDLQHDQRANIQLSEHNAKIICEFIN